MEIIREKIYQPLALSDDFRQFLTGGSWATFDIETLGLSPQDKEIILVGFAEPIDDKTLKISQFFAEDPGEEADLLMATQAYLDHIETVVTYNGASFDLPFYRDRCRKYGIQAKSPYNLDLLNLVRMDKALKNSLPNLKQKTVEKFLGLEGRIDVISGADSVRMYQNYLSNKSEQLKKQILLHNHDDVKELAQIIPITRRGYLPEHLCKKGLPVGKIRISSVKIDLRNRLIVKGHMLTKPILIEAYEDDLDMHTSFGKEGFSISLSLSTIGSFLAISEERLRKISAIDKNSLVFSMAESQYLKQADLLIDKHLVIGPKGNWSYRAAAWLAKHLVERTIKKWKI